MLYNHAKRHQETIIQALAATSYGTQKQANRGITRQLQYSRSKSRQTLLLDVH